MASGTQVPETPVRAGAAGSAPTAPHATPSAAKKRRKTGPERFWDLRRLRIDELERLCGKLMVENVLLKKLNATPPSRRDTP